MTFRQLVRRKACGARSGFSMVELVVVIAIAGVLAGIAVPSLSRYLSQRHLVNAADAFVMSAARARSAALERGDLVRLSVDAATDRVQVLDGAGNVLHSLDLNGEEMRADLRLRSSSGTELSQLVLHYTARGYVRPGGDADHLPAQIGFGNDSRMHWLRMTVVGRVERN